MSKQEVRSFSREFKLRAVQRMEAGENVSALARELSVKRVMLYRWRDARRLGGVEALRLKGRQGRSAGDGGGAGRGRQGQQPGRGPLADRPAAAQGRPAAAGPGFFQASLAAFRGVTPAERSAWRDGVFAKIQAMTRPQGEARQIERLCAVAGVARASYYRHWAASAPKAEESELRDLVQRLALAHRFYGYRRITELVRREGWWANRKRVARIMREDNLLCLRRPVFKPATTDARHAWFVWPNLARHLAPMDVNQLWVADITYVRLSEAFVFLAVILDAFSRKVVGWAMADHLKASLAIEALQMALASRTVVAGSLVHHSDRGVQYACGDYVARLEAAGVLPSMSRAGCPYDNAMAESFMKTLKAEEVDGRLYRDLDHASAEIGKFIDTIYNRQRLHSALDYLSPEEFETNPPKLWTAIPRSTATTTTVTI